MALKIPPFENLQLGSSDSNKLRMLWFSFFSSLVPKVEMYSGTGSPEGVVTANPGALYTNKSGGASTTLYVKESGTGNTGWVAK